MPEIKEVQSPPTRFESFLARLGVIGPTKWFTQDTVIPVALVDAEASITSASSPVVTQTVTSAGQLSAPASGTVMADTTAQIAGNYLIRILGSTDDTLARAYALERRNAADSGNIWQHIFEMLNTQSFRTEIVIPLAAGERFRVIAAQAMAGTVQFTLFFQRL